MLLPLPQPESPNPYTVLSRKALYDSPWIRLREDRVLHRGGGEEKIYPVCGFHRTACGVLSLDDRDQAILVGQWRYPLERYSWEIPEGGGDPKESPFETAQRELAEETGLQAQVWEPLAYFHNSNSSTDEESFLFLATGLSPMDGFHSDDDEELMLHWESIDNCVKRVLSGEITDSLTTMAFLALQTRRSGLVASLDPHLVERFFQRPEDHPSPGRARWTSLTPKI